jgi:hypothetical protein
LDIFAMPIANGLISHELLQRSPRTQCLSQKARNQLR